MDAIPQPVPEPEPEPPTVEVEHAFGDTFDVEWDGERGRQTIVFRHITGWLH